MTINTLRTNGAMIMFERAQSKAKNDADLIPYWNYEGSADIKVQMLPDLVGSLSSAVW